MNDTVFQGSKALRCAHVIDYNQTDFEQVSDAMAMAGMCCMWVT